MKDILTRRRRLGRLFCLFAAITLFTCEKVPDYCGKGSWYDPGVQFCFAGNAYNQCGGGSYNPLTEGCIQGVEVGTRCSDETVVKLGTPCGGYTLTASATPEIGGNVTHTPSDRTTFAAGEQVILSASPNVDFEFVGWAGADSSQDATVTITMNANMPVVAMFKYIKPGTLTTTAFPDNGGYITRNPDSEMYATGETVTVTAAAERGYRFGGWSGDMTSSNTSVTVTMDESKTLVAMFTPIVYTMTVNANPADGGTVFVNGTALAGATSQNFGAKVDIQARAASGYVFTGWSGPGAAAVGDVNNAKATVTLEGDVAVTANFKRQGGTATGVVFGTLVDSRDGQRYKTVKIGEQTWMAANLNYKTRDGVGSWCYDDDPDNCAIYGRLYDWATAMNIDARYNGETWGGSDVGHRGVCPAGWHVSSYLEWEILMVTVGGGHIAGKKLKATSGWERWCDEGNCNGTDEYGFSALPSGFFNYCSFAFWWTAKEYSSVVAISRLMADYNDIVDETRNLNIINKSEANSVRCLLDD